MSVNCGRCCLAVAAGALILAVGGGCSRPPAGRQDQSKQSAAGEAPTVKVVRPERKTVHRSIERPGFNIEAYERTPLYAKIPGYVSKWNFDMGDSVRKDDVVAELSIPEMDADLERKEAAVAQASSEIKQADASVQRSRSELSRARAQYERLSRLTSVIDKDQVDEYRLGFEAAQAAMSKADADVDVAKARLRSAEADRTHVQALLRYTKVRAPYDGLVTRRYVNTGDFVQPAAGKGEPLFVVERVKPVRVYVNVRELDAAWVRDGDAAIVRVQSLQNQQIRGTVTRSAKSLDPQTRTLRVEVDLPNDDGRLVPGMFVNATIVAERKNTWALPSKAVVTQGDQTYCYRVENAKAIRTPVRLGLRGDELVELLHKAVSAAGGGGSAAWVEPTGDESFVADASAVAKDGQAVSVATGK